MTVSQPVMQAVPSFEPLPPLLPRLLDPLPVSNCSATWNKRGCNTEMIVTQYNACYTMLVQLHIVLGTDGRPYPFRSGYHQVLSWLCWFNSPLNKLTIKCFWHLSIDLFKFDMLTAQLRTRWLRWDCLLVCAASSSAEETSSTTIKTCTLLCL